MSFRKLPSRLMITSFHPDAPEAPVTGRKVAQEHFSEESFRILLDFDSNFAGNAFLKLYRGLSRNFVENSQHTASLD